MTVSVGSAGQTIRFVGEGCVGADGSLTVKNAVLHAVSPRSKGDDHGSTTGTTTTTTTTTTSTTTHSM